VIATAYLWWKLAHILGILGFIAAHGVSTAMAFGLRKERDPVRIRALLDLSRRTRSWMYLSLLVLYATGIVDGFLGHWWGQGWIWIALILLTFLLVVAIPAVVPYYAEIRRAVTPPEGGDPSSGRVGPEELARLLSSSRPLAIFWIETIGIVVVAWLMVLKPF